MKTYYEILGVSESDTKDSIKKKFKKLALLHHPDYNKEPGSSDEFVKIREAYEVLIDDQKRKEYDQKMKGGIGINDFFAFFNSRDPFLNKARNENVNIRIKIPATIEELFSGVKKRIRYKRKRVCSECGGDRTKDKDNTSVCGACKGVGKVNQSRGVMTMISSCPSCDGGGVLYNDPCKACAASGKREEEVELSIDIPCGGFVSSEQKFIKDKGHESSLEKNRFGFLSLDIELIPSAEFKLMSDGTTISETFVPLNVALCGGEIVADTLHGAREIKVKSGTKSGDRLKIDGAGFWNQKRTGYSDHVSIVKIEMPENLSEEDKKVMMSISGGKGNYPKYFSSLEKQKNRQEKK